MAGGRPRIYESVEEIEEVIELYIGECKEKKEKPTITGATLYLGFCDKTTLYDYRDRDGFSHSVKRLLLFVENGYEVSLQGSNVAGAIFALKNMGWKDKSEIDHRTPDGVTVLYKQQEGNKPLPDAD
jgi:hypothetical protein